MSHKVTLEWEGGILFLCWFSYCFLGKLYRCFIFILMEKKGPTSSNASQKSMYSQTLFCYLAYAYLKQVPLLPRFYGYLHSNISRLFNSLGLFGEWETFLAEYFYVPWYAFWLNRNYGYTIRSFDLTGSRIKGRNNIHRAMFPLLRYQSNKYNNIKHPVRPNKVNVFVRESCKAVLRNS